MTGEKIKPWRKFQGYSFVLMTLCLAVFCDVLFPHIMVTSDCFIADGASKSKDLELM